jgi:acetyl/propionyl-CoA carboxylase alpha subunit
MTVYRIILWLLYFDSMVAKLIIHAETREKPTAINAALKKCLIKA